MRIKVGKEVAAKKGDVVVFDCYFSEPNYQAKLEIFSGVGEWEKSPHVLSVSLNAMDQGKPMMVDSVRATLNEDAPKKRFILNVDEDITFQMMQDLDVTGDPTAKIKAKAYGKTSQAVGRILRNILRKIRINYEPIPQYRRWH